MLEQVLVQVRVDALLKDQATEVFEKIGIDMPHRNKNVSESGCQRTEYPVQYSSR